MPSKSTVNSRFMRVPPPSCQWFTPMMLDRRQGLAQDVDHHIDMLLLRDERRRDDRAVACRLEMQSVVKQLFLVPVSARTRAAGGMQVDRAEHPVAANVGDSRHVAQ